MGRRVYQGFFEKRINQKQYFQIIIFADADLPIDILNTELKELPAMADGILAYTHQVKDNLSKFRFEYYMPVHGNKEI